VGSATIGAIIGAGILARIPAALDPATLTPHAVRAMPDATQAEIASIYSDVMSPVFAALAFIYAVGIVAAVLLPAARLADEQPVEASDTHPQSQNA
jgi:Ni/Fe-hydrogenase subunit HybB-like protein